MDAFTSLTKALKALDLPLSISAITPIADALRYASVFIPQPRKAGAGALNVHAPLDVMLQFESSARWPDNLEAVQKMKLAFYVRIAEMLPRGTTCEISTGDGTSIFDSGFLNIVHAHYLFTCVRIAHEQLAG